MSNLQADTYATLMALQTDDAKNNSWRPSTVITPRTRGSNTHQKKEKSPMTQPSLKRPRSSSCGQNNSGSHGSFGGSGHNGPSSTKGSWGQSKDAKAYSKGPSKSTSLNKNMKRGKSGFDKNYNS